MNVQQSLIAMKSLKHTGRRLSWDEKNAIIDQLLQLQQIRLVMQAIHADISRSVDIKCLREYQEIHGKVIKESAVSAVMNSLNILALDDAIRGIA